ncbi:MAG: ACP S-malonyltransferase, partial [Planctomycetota bacterium]|nr:ACP S-malonyltransferase [Planctomycetota bacterium]
AILFPGQGAQSVGMGAALCERHPAARAIFDEADDVLGYSLSSICFEGPADELIRTDRAQPAIYVTSVAAVKALEEAGQLDRDGFGASAGLSLGEYTACWFAGVFSFADGLRVVQRRGTAMQEACNLEPSGMVSLIGADRDKAEAVCDAARGDDVLVVANLNSPGQVVLSGSQAACERAQGAAKELGIRRAIPLKVAGAFHSPLMETARASLEAALADADICDARVPVYSNVTAAPTQSSDDIRGLLARQVVNPVLWESSMRQLVSDGMTDAAEPPPGTVLAGLMKKIAPDVSVAALSTEED